MNKNLFILASFLSLILIASCTPYDYQVAVNNRIEESLATFPTDSRVQIESVGELPYDNIDPHQRPIYYILKDAKSGNEFLYIKTYNSGVITQIYLDKHQ